MSNTIFSSSFNMLACSRNFKNIYKVYKLLKIIVLAILCIFVYQIPFYPSMYSLFEKNLNYL